ncbi:MAG: 30S ribosomal protein S1, partial [Calditrichaeota bacterium]|nr:30S ribosomal protein S1 [Calditrichota bacterium]
ISRRIKGGMVVDLFGMEAFLPGSQIDVHPVRDFDALVGASMDFRIIKVNEIRKNVVLSHKVLKEEALREIRAKVLSELQEGQVVEGVVKNITDFGVFVDLGGVDGLLHITDLSWGRVSHPSDVVTLDDRIKVKVLHYDRDKQRISLGLKQLKEHHWEELEAKYPINARVRGKVVSIVKYGAFVELEPGVEGLVHISEMSWTQHVKHPSQMVTLGDEAEVVILNIDRENRKISLGMKQVEEDPWERLQATYVPGTRHTGAVRDLVPFGAFVELEPGIDGLIHISDLSWTRKVRHPGEIVKKGQELEVVVLSFDRNERRIALGLKQIEEDPWDRFERDYTVHTRTDGTVLRVLDKGVVVMLPLGVEGFIPNSQLGRSIMSESKSVLREGDNLELEVLEFDRGNHRIVLTHSQVEKAKERAAYRSYQEGQEDEGRTTIGDILMAGQHPLVEGVGDEAAPAEEAIPAKKPRKKREKKVVEEGSGTEAMEESFTSDETIALDKTVATEETVDGQSLSQPEAEPPAVEEPPTEPV